MMLGALIRASPMAAWAEPRKVIHRLFRETPEIVEYTRHECSRDECILRLYGSLASTLGSDAPIWRANGEVEVENARSCTEKYVSGPRTPPDDAGARIRTTQQLHTSAE
jgi:hypothetical protein